MRIVVQLDNLLNPHTLESTDRQIIKGGPSTPHTPTSCLLLVVRPPLCTQGLIVPHQLIPVRPLRQLLGVSYTRTLAINSDGRIRVV